MSALLDVNPPEPASLSCAFGNATVVVDLAGGTGAAEQSPLADGSVDFGIACSHSGSRPAAGRAFNPGAANGPHNRGKGWPTR
ncbi:MAG: hypothetical protein JNN03_01260 [Rubrivivax sp.]|nr:hypothetical protein [Rubrivivax sp.]